MDLLTVGKFHPTDILTVGKFLNSYIGLTLQSRVSQWLECLTPDLSVIKSNTIKGSYFCIEQETLHLLLSTDSFQKRIRS